MTITKLPSREEQERIYKGKIDEITQEWKIDCDIDGNHLDDAALRTPHLHAKYIATLTDSKLKLSKSKAEYNKLKKIKVKYYSGKFSKEELEKFGWEQWNFTKPIKSEMDDLLKGDDDMISLILRTEYLETMISKLESIIKEISNRTWNIRAAIDYKKFINGN